MKLIKDVDMKISKILFVEPPRNYWFVMGEYLPPPTTLLILAAFVERELPDIEIDIVDCQAKRLSWDALEKYIESSNPSMVLTSGFTCNAYSCARTAEITKKINQDIIIAKAPLKVMFGYTTTLRSQTQGKGSFTMEFLEFDKVG